MPPISAVRPAIVVLAMLARSGCHCTGPDGHAPDYAPVLATGAQREIPVAPANTGPVAPSTPVVPAVPPPDAYAYASAPVYAAPAYGLRSRVLPELVRAPVTIGVGYRGHRGGGYRGGGHWSGGHRH